MHGRPDHGAAGEDAPTDRFDQESRCRGSDEDERASTAAKFHFCKPSAGWRQAATYRGRTKCQGARERVQRVKFCHTRKHGGWLRITENELIALTRQCRSGRRVGETETVGAEIGAWSSDGNERRRSTGWRVKTDNCRYKLKAVYPKIIL